MNIIVLQPTIIGGVDYQPSHLPQNAPDNVGQHMVDIGNAIKYEAKIIEKMETKAVKKPEPSSASQPVPVSQEQTAKPRRGRPPKSS